MCWQRDKNASRNIYKKLQDAIDNSTNLIELSNLRAIKSEDITTV
jgi:hypothetical protein